MLIKLAFKPFGQLKTRFVRFKKVRNINRQERGTQGPCMRPSLFQIGVVYVASIVYMNIPCSLELDLAVKGGALKQVDR